MVRRPFLRDCVWFQTAKTPKNDSIWSTVEKISAYRFFDQEVVGFRDGGALHWRVGDVGGKCGGCPPGTKNCQPTSDPVSPTAVRTYAWVYTWPLDPSDGPGKNLSPAISCPNATICGPPGGESCRCLGLMGLFFERLLLLVVARAIYACAGLIGAPACICTLQSACTPWAYSSVACVYSARKGCAL